MGELKLIRSEKLRRGMYLQIAGALLPAPRPRLGKHGVYLPARYRKHREQLKQIISAHIPPSKRIHTITLTVYRTIPVDDKRYGDVDNLLKTVMDSIGCDDIHITSATVRKYTGTDERIVLSVEWV